MTRKKFLIIAIALIVAGSVNVSAQLTVFNNNSGNVSIKTTTENPYAYLTVSTNQNMSFYYNYSIGTMTEVNNSSSFNV